MGKLNYTNRKSEGLKLGQVCAKDLTKRVPPAHGARAALRDPVVELDVSSKTLSDEGFIELAKALIESILYIGEHGKVVRLEELCLRDNQLTPASLEYLSRIIQLSSADLRDLDLSTNNLCINTAEEIVAWECFLRSFSQCCVLRRVDLSGNSLGSKAFEVLTRVYSMEQPVDLLLPEHLVSVIQHEGAPLAAVPEDPISIQDTTRRMSLVSDSDGFASHDEGNPTITPKKHGGPPHGSKSLEKYGPSSAEIQRYPIYATTKGLRSVPYMIFANTLMDDKSALQLSYILAIHQTPDRLLARVPSVKAGTHAQQLATYDNETQCRGVIYLPNPTLSNTATRVLGLAEKVRDGLHDAASPSNDTWHIIDGTRQAFTQRRRGSTVAPEETHESLATDLDRARSRLQGIVIESHGHRNNDLWRTAFKMLTMSREIRPQRVNDALPPPETPTVKPQIIRTLEIPGILPRKPNAWGMPLAPKSSNQTVPPQPVKSRKDSISVSPMSTAKPPAPTASSVSIHPQIIRLPNKEHRSRLPCGLPEDIWWRILGYAAGASELLSHGQQQSVLRYAMDRTMLIKERDSLGLKEAAQIWHVLDGMDCLAYDMR